MAYAKPVVTRDTSLLLFWAWLFLLTVKFGWPVARTQDRADGFAGDGHGAIGIGCSAHDPLGCLEVVVEPAGHGGTEDDDVASEDSRAEQVAGAANQLPSAAVPGDRLYHRAVVLGQCGLARARRSRARSYRIGLDERVRNALPIPREEVVEQPGQDGTDQDDEVVVADGQLGLALRSSFKDLAGRVRNALPTPTLASPFFKLVEVDMHPCILLSFASSC